MLPAPNLDDRSWDDIRREALGRIALRCPEWTDLNASDPGVTLVELFAWMTEMTLYRLNRVPERNYIKFLDMLGVALEPPTPASTLLRFELSRPIEDRDGEEAFEITLDALSTTAATVRTEVDEAIEFSTDADLHMVRPRLRYALAIPRVESEDENWSDAREFRVDVAASTSPAGRGPSSFALFASPPRAGNGVYFGWDNDVSGNVVELQLESVQAAATGLDEDYPAQVWEVWNANAQAWERLEVALDETRGFNRSGAVRLCLPSNLHSRLIDGKRAYWVRARYTLAVEDVPPRGPEAKVPSPYQRSPEIQGVQSRTVGGTVAASNCAVASNVEVGRSDGTPGQAFALPHAPILARRSGETLLVGERGSAVEDFVAWSEVTDFSGSREDDLHFLLDSASGQILFGPNIVEPDGAARQYGGVPPRGHVMVFSSYRHGGGARGNVRDNSVRVLKSSIPYIAAVSNPRRAIGGRNGEDLERAKMRGQAVLKQRERAVTGEDYEHLAERASPGVGRAHCIQPRGARASRTAGEVPPGVVRLLLVPALGEDALLPRPEDLRVPERTLEEVRTFLDGRRLLATVLEVGEPDYLWVSTDITLVADPRADAEAVARRVQEKLADFIHPLRGGPRRKGEAGRGWPFRRTLSLADVYAQVQAASGVAFLLGAEISVSRLINADEGLLGPEAVVPNSEGVRPREGELLASREHRISVRPMWSVGMDE